jgi:ferredoxin
MSFTVTIRPSGNRFTLEADDTVLTGALREGFVLPYGCRNGACGPCKGRLLAGEVDYGKYQDTALSDAERASGLALFCQAKPLSDVEIECREVSAAKDIPIRKMPCRVERMERAAPDVMVVHLRLPQNERLQYLPGQYVDILMKDGQRRSFSMANAPFSDDLLELHIRDYGGVFSQHAFQRMKPRDILRFEGPFGSFFLREDSSKPVILLASVPAVYDQLTLRMRAEDAEGQYAQIFWTTEDDPEWSESKSTTFELRDVGELRDLVLDLGSIPGWQGTVRALRIDPLESTGRTIEIDEIAFGHR